MTIEAYEKAQELRSKMSHYSDIKDALANSVCRNMRIYSTRYLYDSCRVSDSTHNMDTREEIINSVAILEEDRNLMNRLVAVINEDIRTLQEEFEKL